MDDKPIKVLLIEGSPDDAELIREMLAEAGRIGFELQRVDRLSRVATRLARGAFDVILLDLALPDSRGLDTFAQAYAHAPGVPIVVLSSVADEEAAIRAVREGAQDYLVKNQTDSGQLVRAIRYAIERHHLLKDLLGRARQELLAMGLVDGLTDLYNRRAFYALADRQLKIATRTSKELLLLCVGVDNLKWIQDTLGRHEGNLVLVEIAGLLKRTFRDPDIIARIGGDEFAVLAVNAPGDSAEILTTRLHNNLEALNAQTGHPYSLLLSVSAAGYDPKSACSVDALMERAKGLLSENKKRNQLIASRPPGRQSVTGS